jgi:hypothetical protein
MMVLQVIFMEGFLVGIVLLEGVLGAREVVLDLPVVREVVDILMMKARIGEVVEVTVMRILGPGCREAVEMIGWSVVEDQAGHHLGIGIYFSHRKLGHILHVNIVV